MARYKQISTGALNSLRDLIMWWMYLQHYSFNPCISKPQLAAALISARNIFQSESAELNKNVLQINGKAEIMQMFHNWVNINPLSILSHSMSSDGGSSKWIVYVERSANSWHWKLISLIRGEVSLVLYITCSFVLRNYSTVNVKNSRFLSRLFTNIFNVCLRERSWTWD